MFEVLYTAIRIADLAFVQSTVVVEAEDFDDAEVVAMEEIGEEFDNIEIFATIAI
jgi:hypothetical protein